jgi:hypothetical protein
VTAQPCSSTSAAWGWRALCRSGRMRPIAAGGQGRGSRRRTQRAMRCGGNARSSGASLGEPQPSWFRPNGKPNEDEYSHADNDNRNRGHVELVAPAVVVPLRFSDLMISRRPREEQSLADQGFGRFCSRERSQDGHRGSLSR